MWLADQAETLYVNRSESRCGSCHKNADPYEEYHNSAFLEGEGCGVKYKYVASDYVGWGLQEWAADVRPDLIWIEEWHGWQDTGGES